MKISDIIEKMPAASAMDALQALAEKDAVLWCALNRRVKGESLIYDNSRKLTEESLGAVKQTMLNSDYEFELHARLLHHRPFLKQPARDNHKHKVYEKGRQVGVTELSASEVFHFLATHPGTKWISTFPRDKQLTDFSITRVAHAFGESPRMAALAGTPNQVFTKRVGDSYWIFRSAWESNLGEGVDADGVTLDEKDRMRDKVELAFRESLKSSRHGLLREISTPTLPNQGIDIPFRASDQQVWMVKCQKCNDWQEITYQDNIIQVKDIPLGCKELPPECYEYLCFVPGTPVLGRDGEVRIEDVEPDDEVYTHTGELHRVLNTQERHYRGRVINISVGGAKLRVTPEHPFLVAEWTTFLNAPTWVEAKDIDPSTHYMIVPKKTYDYVEPATKGEIDVANYVESAEMVESDDVVVRLRSNKKFGPKSGPKSAKPIPRFIDLDEETAFVLGLYVAEGNATSRQVYFTFNHAEKALADAVVDFASRIGYEATIYKSKESCLNVRIGGRLIAELFTNLCGPGAFEKRIPHEVMTGTLRIQRAFFSGYFAGDGSIPKFASKAVVATLVSVSEKLISQLQTILMRNGVFAYRYDRLIKAGATKRKHILDVHTTQAAKLARWLGSDKGERLRERIRGRERAFKTRLREDESYFYVPIHETWTEDYDGPVHNFEVETDNSYQVNRFATHNCNKTKCRGKLDRVFTGRWVARHPDRNHIRGYHMPQLIAPWISATRVMQDKIDFRFREVWLCYVLGIPASGELEMLTDLDFELACANHEMVPSRTRDWTHITAGIDWGNVNWCVVMGRNALNQRPYILNIGIFEDEAGKELSSAKAMENFLAPYSPDLVIADAGYGKDRNSYLMRKLCPVGNEGRFYAQWYNPSQKSSRTFQPEFSDPTRGRVLVDRTMALKNICHAIKQREFGIPTLSIDKVQLLMRHMKNLAPFREVDEESKEIIETVRSAGDDHLAHALASAWLGIEKLSKMSRFNFTFE